MRNLEHIKMASPGNPKHSGFLVSGRFLQHGRVAISDTCIPDEHLSAKLTELAEKAAAMQTASRLLQLTSCMCCLH